MLLRTEWSDIQFSSVYNTPAWGHEDQDNFLNAVATMETDQSPQEVHEKLQAIEEKLEKDTPFQWGPRTIDLDLLLYDDQVIDQEGLVIPHPRMQGRRFVLEPLCELIDPESTHPSLNEQWNDLLEKTLEQDCELIGMDL